MKDLCVWMVVLVMLLFAFSYSYQVWKQNISPTISTWIIFLLGTGLSLVTYAVAEKRDFRSGIMNTVDILSVTIILLSIIAWGNRGVRFKPFEKWYLAGIGGIIVYGFLSGDAWGSNLFTQVLIVIGYVPTIHNLITEKRNTEPFTSWGFVDVAGIIALYPAIIGGNALAIVYAARSSFFVSCIMLIMLYYELRSKKAKA